MGKHVKKLILFLIVITILIEPAHANSENKDLCQQSSTGAIMAQHSDGSTDDYFAPGETVYMKTNNLGAGTYWWRIINESKNILASGGSFTVPPDLDMHGPLWTIPSDTEADIHFRLQIVSLEECLQEDNKFFVKNDTLNTIPEFTTIAIPAVIALGGYLALKRKKE